MKISGIRSALQPQRTSRRATADAAVRPRVSSSSRTLPTQRLPSTSSLQRHYFKVGTVLYFLFNQVMPTRRRGQQVPAEFASLNKIHSGGPSTGGVIPSKFTLASWNIEMGYQRERVVTDLHRIRSDVMMLQEVPVFTQESAPLLADFSKYFAYAPGLFIKKRSAKYGFSHRGQLTLSAMQPLRVDIIPLPQVATMNPDHGRHHFGRRIALYTKLRTKHGTLGLYNLHLENYSTPPGRRMQLHEIFAQMKKNNDTYVILAGDFNTIYGRLELLGIRSNTGLVRARHGRSAWPLRLDHILHSKNVVVKARTISTKSSDHCPIVADVELL